MRLVPLTTECLHPSLHEHARGCFDLGGQEQTGVARTTVSSNPFPEQKEAFVTGFERAEDLFQTPVEFFPGSTVVPFSPQQEQAFNLIEQRAFGGSPLTQAGQQNLLQTIQGDFLNLENPAFQALSDRLSGDISSRVNAQFTGSGRRGSSANQEALTRGIGDALAPIAFQQFAQERGNQLAAAQAAPAFAQQDFFDLNQLLGVGQARQGQAGAELQDLVNRFNFGQQEPRQRLAEFFSLIGGGTIPGQGTTTTTQPVFETSSEQNAFSNALGLASVVGSFL